MAWCDIKKQLVIVCFFSQIGFIKPHPLLTQILESDQNSSLIFDAFVMPTYCPPVPWTSPTFGGYIVVPTQLIRMEEGITKQRDLLDHCKVGDGWSSSTSCCQNGCMNYNSSFADQHLTFLLHGVKSRWTISIHFLCSLHNFRFFFLVYCRVKAHGRTRTQNGSGLNTT